MISGECRVEGIPSPGSTPRSPSSDRKLAIDGLRLQLDLRILPGTGGDATAAAVWRIESESVATLPARGHAAWRRAAIATGGAVAGASLLAIGLWFANPSQQRPAGSGSPVTPVPSIPAAATPRLAGARGTPTRAPAAGVEQADAAATPATPEGRRVAPRIAVVPAEADPAGEAAPPASPRPFTAPPAMVVPPITPPSSAPGRLAPSGAAPPGVTPSKATAGSGSATEPASRTRHGSAPPPLESSTASSTPSASSASASRAAPASAEGPLRRPAAPHVADALLDLFGDTK